MTAELAVPEECEEFGFDHVSNGKGFQAQGRHRVFTFGKAQNW